MARCRLIFTLLFGEGGYNLSRNFRLQKVGDLNWVRNNYDFESIARSIDELIVLDVNRDGRKDVLALCHAVRQLSENCFMPVAAGGGILNLPDAQKLFKAGADKLALNSAYFHDSDFVRDVARMVGVQSVVASLDYRRDTDGERRIYSNDGSRSVNLSVTDAVKYVQDIGAGEIYLTSIDHDGTASGFDLEVLPMVAPHCEVPLIISGGAGYYAHFKEAFDSGFVSAASTANLFNFMADGLADARASLLDEGVDLSVWNFADEQLPAGRG